jgi:hypothetical protein
MAKQTFTTGQVLTAAQMTSLQQTAMGGGSATPKTASYVLVAADAGTVIQMNAAGATTITVNTALFSAGDTVQIQNIGAGVCTVTAGTATVNTSATLALSQYDAGTLYFNTTSAAIFFAVDAADASSFVGCSAYKSTTQSIANSTNTILTFDSESFDTSAFHSTSVNNSRITIPAGKAGKYLVNAIVGFGANGTGIRTVELHKNGSITSNLLQGAPGSASVTYFNGSIISNLAAADYLELSVFQSSGGALNVSGGTDATIFSVTYLGA